MPSAMPCCWSAPALMHGTGSMLPMALGASACLMLTVPLVRQFALRKASSRRL